MPRNSSGVYTLPAGNPVTTRTIIESSWANNTLSDIATEITESLARNGAGGMTGPMKATDGTAAAPSITFGSETSTGLYRVASGQLGIATGGVQRFNISSSGSTFSVPVTVSSNLTVSGTISGNGSSITSLNASNISSGTLADARLSSNVPLKNAANAFTASQTITGSSGVALTINGVAAQYSASFNGGTISSGDLLGIDVYGSTPGYVVSRLRNTHASGYTAVEVHGANGAASAFIGAHPTKAVFGANTNTQVEIWTNNTQRIAVSQNGNVTIAAPVSGTTLYVYGDIYATGTITQGSDERLKTNVQTIDGALAKVCAMRGVSFTRKDTGKREVGVIAQEVAEVVPEVVSEVENGNLSVAYGNMVGVLIEAVKELRDEVWQLKAKCCH
jgi:uncharacterized protein YaiE (UPF0345 family)